MTTRTRDTVIHFSKPFSLTGFADLPAGDYRVDHDEEALESGSWLAWRHVVSFIHIPRIGVLSSTHQMVPIKPAELEAILEMDQAK